MTTRCLTLMALLAALPAPAAPVPSPSSAPRFLADGRVPAVGSPAAGADEHQAGSVTLRDATLARDISNSAPKDPISELSTAQKRLLLWAHVQVDGGSAAIAARWYATETGERLLGEYTLPLPDGESRVVCWLETAAKTSKFPLGPMRVDLIADGRVLKSLVARVHKASLIEELKEAAREIGQEFNKLFTGKK